MLFNLTSGGYLFLGIGLCLIAFCPEKASAHLGHDHSTPEKVSEVDPEWLESKSISLSQKVGVDLRWKPTGDEDSWVTMKMSSPTTGYVAVGFCARWLGTMEGCDIVLGWVDDTNGTVHLYDYHADGNGLPTLDATQNYEIISGIQKDRVTTITFKRKWDTGDDNDDANLDINSVHIIYAWHIDDPLDQADFPMHAVGSRGHTTGPVAFKTHDDNHDHEEHEHEHSHGHGSANKLISFSSFSIGIVFMIAVLNWKL